METQPLYSAIANNEALRNYLRTKKLRRLVAKTASSTSVLLMANRDRNLADRLLLDGLKEGIERHLLDLLSVSKTPSKKETLTHLADSEGFTGIIYVCTSRKLSQYSKSTIDKLIYGNALMELSMLSPEVATHYHNHVMENYARRSVKR